MMGLSPGGGARRVRANGLRPPTCLLVYLLVALLMEELAHVIEAAGHGAPVGLGVLQVLVRNVRAGEEHPLGLGQTLLVHQDDPRVQVGGCRHVN